jgi:hypothetical protein
MNDCLFTIAQFAESKQATQLTREFAKKFFPSSITIDGHKQLEELYNWARYLDTSNLTEVRIVIRETKLIESLRTNYPKAVRPDGLVIAQPIGLVPPSVKKLTLCVYTNEIIEVSSTVEELVVECAGCNGISVPDSIRSIHLKDGFYGIVYKWPENLERLVINGWCRGNGRWPVQIDEIPDTVKQMVVGSHLDIEITHWPDNLETVVFEGDPEDYGWSLDDAGISEEVNVIVISNR